MNMPMQFQIDVAPAVRTATERALRGLRVAVRQFLARWRRHRQAAAMRATLRGLDAHTLRDLGFHRSEIESVVAEVTGDAEPTRLCTQRTLRQPY
jgi:uncharacterized protein YjiS (DUF1127 family)